MARQPDFDDAHAEHVAAFLSDVNHQRSVFDVDAAIRHVVESMNRVVFDPGTTANHTPNRAQRRAAERHARRSR